MLSIASERDEFLKSGALFGTRDGLWLFWGEPNTTSVRPEQPALAWSGDFFTVPKTWLVFPYGVYLNRLQLLEIFKKEAECDLWRPRPPLQSQFNQMMEEAQKSFKTNELKKVVPVVFESSPQALDSLFLWHRLVALANSDRQGWRYGYWNSESGILGLTPELLLGQEQDHTFYTMALASTFQAQDEMTALKLYREDQKLQAEHQWVIEDIHQKLERWGEVFQQPTEVCSAGPFWHGRTQLELQSIQADFMTLMQELHPTAALGGYPTKAAVKLLKSWDQEKKRAGFGAPFVFSQSQVCAHAIVAIRNIYWDAQGVYLGSGCGVIPESNWQAEWNELNLKRASVRQLFNLQSEIR